MAGQRAEEKRQAKREYARHQVKCGSLAICQVTEEEHRRCLRRSRRPGQLRGRGR